MADAADVNIQILQPLVENAILHGLREKSSESGYGVWNIHERIQLSYGPQYGLRYTSRPYIGTTVYITFPALL